VAVRNYNGTMRKFKPGIGFSDFVVTDQMEKRIRIGDDQERNFRMGWLVWILVLVGFSVLGVRLLTLQVFFGERYRLLSDENRVRTIKLVAPRGVIADRNGVELAANRLVGEKWRRVYLAGEAFSHMLGYVGEVTEDEVGLMKERGLKFQVGDFIGRSGVEEYYEEALRGIDGGILVEVDNQGIAARQLGRRQPVGGERLILGIDADLQKTGFEAMGNKKGAVVASDPKTGELLVLTSSPSFDANSLTANYSDLITNADMPFLNRTVGGVYPPGSIFKMITTSAAIESGEVLPGFTFEDAGVIKVNEYSYYNWLFTKRGGVEGTIGFTRAITRSTDTFFYKVGEKTGPENIADWATKFGLSQKTGIDLPGEVTGLIPDPDWKMEVKNERWYLGDTYIMSIGQGDILVTPLQMNVMTNVLATGGSKCVPHLLKNPSGKCQTLPMAKSTLDIIEKGMVGACSSGGTAYVFFDWNDAAKAGLSQAAYTKAPPETKLPLVACKTGTAEYWDVASGKMKTHGWLTAYAPADNPQISVTVLMEGGGEGSDVAAPVVRKVLAKYFGITDTYPYQSIRKGEGE